MKCNCEFMPGIDGKTKIEGYDPSEYKKQYRSYLEGHELEETLDVQERYGKTTNKVYKTAAYDYKAAGFGSRKSGKYAKYVAEGEGLSFTTFEDVKQYIYEAKSMSDLERRYSVLKKIYGADSEQMNSLAMKNAFMHAEKEIKRTEALANRRNSIGAVYNEVYAARDAEVKMQI